MSKVSRPLRILISFLIIILLASGAIFAYNSPALGDYIKAFGYQPSQDISEIQQALKLTDRGTRIFLATRPALEQRDDFNIHCKSHNPQISVLGCYSLHRIYIYQIDNTELAGIKESTAAHELLHAVWERLSDSERQALQPFLQQVYREHQDLLAEELDVYAASDQFDELHSRVGTQITNLPKPLQQHYAQFFQQPETIVAFYTSYSQPFKLASQQIKSLASEMKTLQTTIDTKSSQYQTRSQQFSHAVTEFNHCAATTNCFPDLTSFHSRRQSLVQEQASLSALYSELEQMTNTYNQKVKLYNSNILRTQNLQDSINSNRRPATI